MNDSRDFIAVRRRAEIEVLLPAGPKVAFTGGLDFNNHRLIWDRLHQVRAKHPDMVLLDGGSSKGAERIAAAWADKACKLGIPVMRLKLAMLECRQPNICAVAATNPANW